MASPRAFLAAFAARRVWVLLSFFCLLAQNVLRRLDQAPSSLAK
jgi:hypothetical protein